MAGQHIALNVKSPDISDLTNCSWIIPDFPAGAVDGYSPTSDSALANPSTADVNSANIAFYWTRPFTNQKLTVACTLTAASVPVSLVANATYTVEEPVPSVTLQYGNVVADQTYHRVTCATPDPSYFLHYGDPCGTPAIQWNYSVAVADPGEAGSITMFQLINQYSGTADGTGPAYCADNLIPYDTAVSTAGSWISSDAPAIGLATQPTAFVNQGFKDYFMYMPASNNTSSGPSIWVALANLEWGWHASTTLQADGTFSAPNIIAMPRPTLATPYTTLPTWGCKFTNVVP